MSDEEIEKIISHIKSGKRFALNVPNLEGLNPSLGMRNDSKAQWLKLDLNWYEYPGISELAPSDFMIWLKLYTLVHRSPLLTTSFVHASLMLHASLRRSSVMLTIRKLLKLGLIVLDIEIEIEKEKEITSVFDVNETKNHTDRDVCEPVLQLELVPPGTPPNGAPPPQTANSAAAAYPPAFDEVWSLYPKQGRKEKPRAFKAWKTLLLPVRDQVRQAVCVFAREHGTPPPQGQFRPPPKYFERFITHGTYLDYLDEPPRPRFKIPTPEEVEAFEEKLRLEREKEEQLNESQSH